MQVLIFSGHPVYNIILLKEKYHQISDDAYSLDLYSLQVHIFYYQIVNKILLNLSNLDKGFSNGMLFCVTFLKFRDDYHQC